MQGRKTLNEITQGKTPKEKLRVYPEFFLFAFGFYLSGIKTALRS